jgi:hypothetical protein
MHNGTHGLLLQRAYVSSTPLNCNCRDEEFKGVGQYNFDHPNAFDWDLVKETFEKLLSY